MTGKELWKVIDQWSREQPDLFVAKIHGNRYQKRGITDLIGNVGPVGFYFELKRKGEKPRKQQTALHKKIAATGGVVQVVYTLKQFKELVFAIRSFSNGLSLPPSLRYADQLASERRPQDGNGDRRKRESLSTERLSVEG